MVKFIQMVRKRIKTLAQEWSIKAEDVLASCRRLRLFHANSESSLLSAAEASRVKADLDQEANRAAVLRRETVIQTSGGKVVESRLNATVMRRRHAEPKAILSSNAATAPGEAFSFFVTNPQIEMGALAFEGAGAPTIAELAPSVLPNSAVASAAARPETAVASRGGAPLEMARRAGLANNAQASGSRDASATQVASPPANLARTINLTGAAHALAPMLDEAPRGPKVLGKIDLHKPAARPTAMPKERPGMGQRPLGRPHPSPSSVLSAMPAGPAKPVARPFKQKRVVQTRSSHMFAERTRRGMRAPQKRRALPGSEQRNTEITTPKASKRVVRITEGVTVAELARNMGVKAAEVIKKLMGLGAMSTLNQVLDLDTATLVASEFGYTVENVAFDVESAIHDGEEVAERKATPRPPVVTVMGHVDHGKTSLLDAIRHTNVTEQEFGGITQHIGAYMVEVNGRRISFVDTPGHEAFTAMRARGAKVTDIVVLVVAADEGVMPQTAEAISHARVAGVPIIVAINKIDRPEANVGRVKQQLSGHGLIPEEYSGDTIVVPVSARTRQGIDRLLEMVLLQADVMELAANFERTARGTVIESQLDRGRGPVVTVLIQEGTLRQGDPFVCGVSYGRVRAMLDHAGHRLTEAGPSTPVEIFGLSDVPEPGTPFTALREEGKARQVAEFRRSKEREGMLRKSSRLSLEELSKQMMAGEVKELRLILKGDVNGSVEALTNLLQRLSTDEVKLDLIHTSVGAISETDVMLAAASNAILVGFNVRPESKAAHLAEREGVEIRLYTIVYDVVNDIRQAMEGLLTPTYREKSLGLAEVRKTFMVQGSAVAGAMVTNGKVQRGARARLVRDGRVMWEGKIGSLKRFKDDAREVQAGYECGIGLENFNDVKPLDVIENFEMEAVARKLAAAKPQPARRPAATAQTQLQA